MTKTEDTPQQHRVHGLLQDTSHTIARLLGKLNPLDHHQGMMHQQSSQAQPLAGAMIYLLDSDEQYMSAVEVLEVVQVIQALGGTIVGNLQLATHALLVQDHTTTTTVSAPLEHGITTAQALSIPVVTATPWLQRCAGLQAGQHWSEVPLLDLLPPIVQHMNMTNATQNINTPPQSQPQSQQPSHRRRDSQDSLSQSIAQTFQALAQENPELLEQEALRRAMELSLLDCALVVHTRSASSSMNAAPNPQQTSNTQQQTPHQVLGLPLHPPPTSTDIKAAYRKLAKQTHPDRGGSHEAFQQVAMAYRSLLISSSPSPSASLEAKNSHDTDSYNDNGVTRQHLKSTAHWDHELADHRLLVQELFAGHGATMDCNVATQQHILANVLHLEARNAGSVTVNEQQTTLHNSCFYLSLAASYLSGIGALDDDENTLATAYQNESNGIASVFCPEDRYLIGETALQLKRLIEAAVVSAHPEWAASGMVGEQVQAFSDFLVYLLDVPETLISDWAVVVFDTTSGVCHVFKGKYYDDHSKQNSNNNNNDNWPQHSNCITIQYLPGHYEPLLPMTGHIRPNLSQILQVLDTNDVFYVVTDGAA